MHLSICRYNLIANLSGIIPEPSCIYCLVRTAAEFQILYTRASVKHLCKYIRAGSIRGVCCSCFNNRILQPLTLATYTARLRIYRHTPADRCIDGRLTSIVQRIVPKSTDSMALYVVYVKLMRVFSFSPFFFLHQRRY